LPATKKLAPLFPFRLALYSTSKTGRIERQIIREGVVNFERLKFVPFLLWIAFFAFGVGATLSNPHREGSGFKGVHSNIAAATATPTR
jgi:hypothetical protein